MKKTLTILFALSVSAILNAQTAPSHLKYFGFAIIDCLYDDPIDGDTTTNYIAEVDSFSNIAQMCVYDYNDNIISRVNLMNSYCILPILHIQNMFYELVDNSAPSGENFDLISNFTSNWNTFKSTNSSVLNITKIAAFYIADEPFWNGMTFQDLDTVCKLIKTDYPDIPIMLIEAYGALSILQVPTKVDWLGFDEYGIFNPDIDQTFLADLALLKSKRSTPDQDVFLVIDDQWLPLYGNAGFTPDTIRFMVQNYYNLAASDPDIIGLIGYLWPGGLDDPGQLGVRNMPQSVIDINVEIGQMIKANFSPCETLGLSESAESHKLLEVFPNPASNTVTFLFENTSNHIVELIIYNFQGQVVRNMNKINTNTILLNMESYQSGLYFYTIKCNKKTIGQGKIIKE
jgi:hypothetical protein